MPLIHSDLHLPAFLVALDEPGHLRPAQARHFLKVLPQQASHFSALLLVLVIYQSAFDPLVDLLFALAFEPDALAGVQECADLVQG